MTNKNSTELDFDKVFDKSKTIFISKLKDYGVAWRILRISSLTDQIMIKAKRIRSIEQKGVMKVDEGVDNEFIGIINYCIISLIQLEKGVSESLDTTNEEAEEYYIKYMNDIKELMLRKNHDYGEAWKGMRISSFTDLIIQKLLRIKQIEDNKGKTLISEGIDANYMDIVNYSVFALIKMN